MEGCRYVKRTARKGWVESELRLLQLEKPVYSGRVIESITCDTVLPFSDSIVHEYHTLITLEPQATFNVTP